jgi:hypothetical protein
MDRRVGAARQRKTYAMSRLQRAMARLVDATTANESIQAKRWVNAWGSAVGKAYFDETGDSGSSTTATIARDESQRW